MADISGFHNVQFPVGIAMGAVGGPGYKTDIVEFQNGKEQRNERWTQSRMAWDAAHAIKDAGEMAQLVSFFRNRRGRAYGFRFKDWSDYQVEGGLFANGDGTTKVFQLTKSYAGDGSTWDDGSEVEYRKITRPVLGTVTMQSDGGQALTGWTLDYSTGLVTFLQAPAAGTHCFWTGEFDVPVRFDTDQMKYSMDDYNIYTWGQIPIVELKE